MTALIVLLGIATALVTALIALFTSGAVPAVIVLVILLGLTLTAIKVGDGLRKLILAGLTLLLIAMVSFGGYSSYQLARVLAQTSGHSDSAELVALGTAKAKFDSIESGASFRIELTEAELTAAIQDALFDNTHTPIRAVTLDIIDGNGTENGSIEFAITFKRATMTGHGAVGADIDAGRLSIDIINVSVGDFALPGIAIGVAEDIVEAILEIDERFAEKQIEIQAVEIGGDQLVIIGSNGTDRR